jgi:hypothetical protein
VNDAGEDVPPDIVGAEEMRGRGAFKGLVDVDGERRLRREQAGGDRHGGDDGKQCDADGKLRIASHAAC